MQPMQGKSFAGVGGNKNALVTSLPASMANERMRYKPEKQHTVLFRFRRYDSQITNVEK